MHTHIPPPPRSSVRIRAVLCDLIRLIICKFVLDFFFWEATDATVSYSLIQELRPLIFHLALTT